MPSEANLTIARRSFDEVWSGGDLSAVDEIFADDYRFHDASIPEVKGREGLKHLVTTYRTAFANLQFTVLDEIAGGDEVASRWRATSTHAAEFNGIKPTGKEVAVSGISIDRIEDGKIVETWTNWDTLGLLQQLGAVPETPAS